jgi:sporulation protein YlmC with PRC-barrel domain
MAMEKQIELGAHVRAEDGAVGTVDKIVVNPEEREPEYLVIKRGRVRRRKIVVPVSLMADVSGTKVTLDTTRKALESFPDYEITVREGEYQKPVPVVGPAPVAVYTPPMNRGYVALRQRNVPEASVAVEKGMDVVGAKGDRVGKVQGLIAESGSREAFHLVLRQSHPLASKDRLIPVDLVAEVRSGTVHLRITSDHLRGLPTHQPSREENRDQERR